MWAGAGKEVTAVRTLTGAFAVAFLVILVAPPSDAEPVAVEDAKLIAMNIYSERNPANPADVEVIGSLTEEGRGVALYHIFNFLPNGFVIVSADDAAMPALGYCFHQHYGPENHPPQFDALLDSYKEQIAYVKREQLPPTDGIQREWERLANGEPPADGRTVVGPLMNTHWNQGSPWNSQCPADGAGPGGHVYAGCVAVSMAQAMKYHNYPSQGTGSHGYTHPNYGYLYANFGATTYDWGSMQNNSSTAATELLLYHCGVAVDMDYGPYGSGAYASDISPALKNYFGYDSGCSAAYRDYYSTTVWESMLRGELDGDRPMPYWGGAHAFNLDGYDDGSSPNQFHFNWGWSGSYDGWYYLSNLNPGGNNFTYGQGGILGMLIPVELASFTASGADGRVVLAWITQSETDNLGFHVYRSESPKGTFGRLTEELIAGHGTSALPHSYSFTDHLVSAGIRYYYELADVDCSGNETTHGPVSVLVLPSGRVLLGPSQPNPFAEATAINFTLREPRTVGLHVYNSTGELVRTLANGPAGAGLHVVRWDGRDEIGAPVLPGVYTCTLEAGGLRQSRKLVLAK
jgi:hypothetical protein